MAAVTDKVLLAVLNYRAQLHTCLGTFMEPWLRVAEQSGGLIYTQWNQTKMERGSGTMGTRTGRLSSTPNFQNAPKEFKPLFRHEKPESKLPKCPFNGLPALPLVRSYIYAPKGQALIDRDYSQQEPRILAHFEGGPLMEQYQANPWIDFHDHARNELERVMGISYDRKKVKTINLGIIYGMGVGLLAERNESTVEETQAIKKAILQMYPGLKEMYNEMRMRAASNQPIRTWGGREVFCEPPKFVDGELRTYDYKMVNYLIQGSAADCTKEAIIRLYDELVALGRAKEWFIILNVHDQITMLVPRRDIKAAMRVLRDVMEGIEFDVQMLSEGSISLTNWAELKDYDKKGALL
jgi:DNA polymerase I-like protein with 3'-5' exonuclease and polymerase domains